MNRSARLLFVGVGFLVSLSFTPSLQAQGPQDVIRHGIFGGDAQLMPLLTHYAVRRDIELSMEQWKQLKPHILRWKGEFDIDRSQDFLDQSKWIKVLDEVLLPHQLKRLQEIHWQAMGFHVFVSPTFVKEIELTKEQKEDFRAIFRRLDKEADEISEAGDDARGKPAKIRKLLQWVSEQVQQTLTQQQLKAMPKLLGKKFDLEKIGTPRY